MKPTIVFTNFWDANAMAQDGYMTFCCRKSETEKSYYGLWLNNYQVYSIALGIPDSSKIPNLKDIFRLDYFCPTYKLLTDYKKDKDWEKYRTIYRSLLLSRANEIEGWVDSLEDDKVYVLCCWEDTSKNCNCHRELLFNMFKSTNRWKDKAIWVYRQGNGKYIRLNPSGNNKFESQLGGAVDVKALTDALVGIATPIDLPYDDLDIFAADSADSADSSSYTYSEVAGAEDQVISVKP